MFHEMSDESREILIAHITEWQDYILRRENVKRRENELYPGQTADDLPAGTGHAFGRMGFAIDYLRAPEATHEHRLKEWNASKSLRHKSGCYSTTQMGRRQWDVSRIGMPRVAQRLWIVESFPTAEKGESYYLIHEHGDTAKYQVDGESWLAVLDAVDKYYLNGDKA